MCLIPTYGQIHLNGPTHRGAQEVKYSYIIWVLVFLWRSKAESMGSTGSEKARCFAGDDLLS